MVFFRKSRKTKEIQREKATPNTDKPIFTENSQPHFCTIHSFSELCRNGVGNKQIGVCKNNSRERQEGRYETATTIEKSLER